MTTSNQHTKLTQTDLQAIEARVENEIKALGAAPTLETLHAEGHRENRWLNATIDHITGVGRILTLLIAEVIQSGAVLLIATVFAMLEYQRVFNGAIALGQLPQAANLIAFAVVTANVVYPIYMLRDRRNQSTHTLQHGTFRGYIGMFWKNLLGKPTQEQVSWMYNPTLSLASRVIKLTTIALAIYDLLSPLLISILTGVATKPMPILVGELAMGFGLSLAGVLFLQSAAHEIGIRTLTDKPKRLNEILEEKLRAYDAKVDAIRDQVTADHMAGKIEDLRRKSSQPNVLEVETQSPFLQEKMTVNENGEHQNTLLLPNNKNGRGANAHDPE